MTSDQLATLLLDRLIDQVGLRLTGQHLDQLRTLRAQAPEELSTWDLLALVLLTRCEQRRRYTEETQPRRDRS